MFYLFYSLCMLTKRRSFDKGPNKIIELKFKNKTKAISLALGEGT